MWKSVFIPDQTGFSMLSYWGENISGFSIVSSAGD